MQSYNVKQNSCKLTAGNRVLIKLRPNLLMNLYLNHYASYMSAMDEHADGIPYHIDMVTSQSAYNSGVCLRIRQRYWAYPYFVLDKVETYNVEEDI